MIGYVAALALLVILHVPLLIVMERMERRATEQNRTRGRTR